MTDHQADRSRPAVVLNLTDYGAEPDSGRDATPAMRRALETAARTEGPVVLSCPAGRYDFHPQEAARLPYYITNTASEEENPDVTKTIAIHMKGLKRFTLDGNGSLFLFHGRQTLFVIDACDRVSIRNVRTDYAWPTVAEMTVEQAGDTFLDTVVHADSRYTLANGELHWIGDGWRFRAGPTQQFDPVRNTTWRIDNVVEPALRVEELGPRRLRLHYAAAPPIPAGHVLQMRDGLRDQVGALVTESRHVEWRNVGMHFMHGLGIVCQFSENLSFERMELAPRQETGRTTAAFADFIHLSGCRGKIRIANSRFTGGHDDPVNVHGTYLRIVERPAADRIVVRFMHPQTYGLRAFRAGDEIEFVDGGSLTPRCGGRVVDAQMLNPRELLLTLDKPAPETSGEEYVVENVTWSPEVEIVGNAFARIPTRGVLVSTRRKVVIRGNRFERMAMSAVLIAGDADSWYESGSVENVLIHGNRFLECGGAAHPVIAIAPENREVRPDNPVHFGVRVEANRFDMRDAVAFSAKSARLLIFANNDVRRAGRQDSHAGGREGSDSGLYGADHTGGDAGLQGADGKGRMDGEDGLHGTEAADRSAGMAGQLGTGGTDAAAGCEAIRLTACDGVLVTGNTFHGQGRERTLRLQGMEPEAIFASAEQRLNIRTEAQAHDD